MRLLCVGNRYPPWSTGGYEVLWEGSVRALRASGHSVRVLTTRPDPSDRPGDRGADPEAHRELRWYWRNHEFPPLGLRETIALERVNAEVLARHLTETEADAVVWWSMGGMSLSLLEQVRRTGIPALGIVADDWMTYGPRVDGWLRRWHGVRRAGAAFAERSIGVPSRIDLDRSARWVFISEHLRSAARAGGDELRDSSVVHPGVDPDRFARCPPEPWRWRLLYCGRLDPRKGVSTAIEALAQLPPSATLTIDGDGSADHVAELAGLAASLGVEPRVSFRCSRREDVPAVYGAADAVVFPVRWQEPWGLVPLEAMSVGRPVLASRAGGGPAEYLQEGVNCALFDPGDAAALAALVWSLAQDADLRGRLIEGGVRTAARFAERAFHERLECELRVLTGA